MLNIINICLSLVSTLMAIMAFMFWMLSSDIYYTNVGLAVGLLMPTQMYAACVAFMQAGPQADN